tara:strand:- start:109544 stop:111370 length:1827 start_codon:yes stop_codon:yes gene_type:complete
MGVIVRNKNITIAVLPFKVINKNERLRTLIHGLTEDLITNLSKFVGLAVISQLSTEQITDTSDYGEIDKLTADYLIIGSVRNVADSLRITIQLIKGDDKSVVFSEQYNKSVGEIFDAQDIIIQQIVNVLQKEINYDLLSYSYRKETVDVVVYENWLMGMETLKKGSVENDDIARQYFEAALKIDPHYAPAYTGLSLSYFNEWSCQVWDRWDVSRGNAHKYALKAIEFDKNDYRALAVLGRTYLYAGEYENAEHCARKSLRMNPNDTDNLLLVGFTLMYVGFPQEAAQLYQKAMELDPLHVENNYFAYGSGFYLECGDYEKSAELGLKVDTDRCWIDFPAFLAAAYFHLSDFDNMWKYWNIYLSLFKPNIYDKEERAQNEDVEAEALNWMINVNPYKGETVLTPFWDYLKENKNITPSRREDDRRGPAAVSGAVVKPGFIFKNDVWELNFKGESVLLKDAKGLHDIHKLLSAPEKEFHSMELMGSALDDGAAATALDARAKAEYQARIQELQSEIRDAEDMNDTGRLTKYREEYDAILDHLSSSLGLAGKSREIGSTAEKSRSAITWRIRSALKKIEKTHPEMAHHLAKSINTGTFCSYKPEIKIDWHL